MLDETHDNLQNADGTLENNSQDETVNEAEAPVEAGIDNGPEQPEEESDKEPEREAPAADDAPAEIEEDPYEQNPAEIAAENRTQTDDFETADKPAEDQAENKPESDSAPEMEAETAEAAKEPMAEMEPEIAPAEEIAAQPEETEGVTEPENVPEGQSGTEDVVETVSQEADEMEVAAPLAEEAENQSESTPEIQAEEAVESVSDEAGETEDAVAAPEESEAEKTPEIHTDQEVTGPVSEEAAPETKEEASAPADETLIELTPEQVADDSFVVQEDSNEAVQAIADANAEESEHETRQDIPMQDYESLSMDELADALEKLVDVEKVLSVKDHVEEIRKAFMGKYHQFIEEKRTEWQAENPETTEEFNYNLPVKPRFDKLYSQYRDRKSAHFKSQEKDLQKNLENRLAIVEELKNLINPQEKMSSTLKHFNDIRERWKNAGPIPKDKYNHVWNNYHFHVENFYDYLHLDREARDIDFKHNLDQKQKIIARVEELVHEPDINKSFRELQDLHRLWKEEIGPVSRDYREQIWQQFSDLTKQIHDRREVQLEGLRAVEKENLEKKKEIISRLEALAQEKVNSHALWIAQMQKVEALRSEFFAAGKVPSEVNEQTWTTFKNAVRSFNVLKNSFYKEIKKDQNDNLSRKQTLIAKANELKETEDFNTTTPVMKQIQEEWKQIGHVPRKFSDKLWTEFKAACNHYFERLKENRTAEDPQEVEAYESKKAYLEIMRDFELTGEHKTDLDAIKKHIETWKGLGKVPASKRHVEGKFNKILDPLFEKLSLSKKDTEMMRFSNRISGMSGGEGNRKIDNEKIFLMRKIDEVQSEIFQLENNIQFFTNKNQKKESPFVAEVRKNIEAHKEELATLKQKLKQVRNLPQE